MVFGLINMNGRMYDPMTGQMLAPDNYVPMAWSPGGYNRYNYANSNPLKFIDPDGNRLKWWEKLLFVLINPDPFSSMAGMANIRAHEKRGEDFNFGKALDYYAQGAIVNMATQNAITNFVYNAPFLTANFLRAVIGGNWDRFNNTQDIYLGQFYLDENKTFFGGIGEGISRNTREVPQTIPGLYFTQTRNYHNDVDRVDYFGGATFATKENAEGWWGITLGNFINIQRDFDISTFIAEGHSFDDYVRQDQLYRHEYGHFIDSKRFGTVYMSNVGFFSALSAGKLNHRLRWYERSASKRARRYFERQLGFNEWDEGRHPINNFKY